MPRDAMVTVHPTAKVHPKTHLGPGVVIGPNVEIDEDVVIGAYAVIGTMPEHRDFYNDKELTRAKGVIIRPGARIFEFTTIHSGTERKTEIGEAAAILNHSHVGHDASIGMSAVVGSYASALAFSRLLEGAVVASYSILYEGVVMGAYSHLMIRSFLNKHVPPGQLWGGELAGYRGSNDRGIEHAGARWTFQEKQFKQQFRHWVETLSKGFEVGNG